MAKGDGTIPTSIQRKLLETAWDRGIELSAHELILVENESKKLEKLQKLYALASNNPNQNEAIVAAHKFINAIKKMVHMTLSEQPQATQEQINQALQANYQKVLQRAAGIPTTKVIKQVMQKV